MGVLAAGLIIAVSYGTEQLYLPQDKPCNRVSSDSMQALSIEAALVQFRYDKLMGWRRLRSSKPPKFVDRESISAPSAGSGFHSAVIWEELSRTIGVDFILTWYDGELPHPRYLVGWGECGSMYLLRGFDVNHYWQMVAQECDDCADVSVMRNVVSAYLELSWPYPDIHEVLSVVVDSVDTDGRMWVSSSTQELYIDDPKFVHRIVLKGCAFEVHEIDTLRR